MGDNVLYKPTVVTCPDGLEKSPWKSGSVFQPWRVMGLRTGDAAIDE